MEIWLRHPQGIILTNRVLIGVLSVLVTTVFLSLLAEKY